jgi:hypothetical protein
MNPVNIVNFVTSEASAKGDRAPTNDVAGHCRCAGRVANR